MRIISHCRHPKYASNCKKLVVTQPISMKNAQ